MDSTRRSLITLAPAAVAVGIVAPLTGCEAPPSGPTSVEQIEFTEGHAQRIRKDIESKLRLYPPDNYNEMVRLLFSIRAKEVPKRLDMQGPLMRVFMEFFANNTPDMLTHYRISQIPNRQLVDKRKKLYDSVNFKIAFLRYCSENSRRNSLLSKPLEDLYIREPGALMVDPKMPQAKMSSVALARARWVENVKNMSEAEIERLARRLNITGGFEVGTNTGFVFDTPLVSVQ